ncbi:MAG: regulatory protein GntR [Paenibacillus sp.]|nr:regulatory protein GntR [Paenibacillus sp.]
MVHVLRQEILLGVYTAGDYLPSEAAHASRFGLSNKSVRKGMEQLVEEGLIEKIPKVGSRVKRRNDVTITLAYSKTNLRDMEQEGLLADFQQRYPWVRVEAKAYETFPDLDEQSGSGPYDLYILNNDHFVKLAEKGQLGHLEPLSAPPDAYPFLIRQFTDQGQLYAQPVVFSPIVLCYNKAHFRECGLPEPDGSWTWDDLVRNAELLKDDSGRYGFSFHLPDNNRWPIFLMQSGERFEWDGAKLRDIRGTRLLESIRLCKRLVHNRGISPQLMLESNGEIGAMFRAGKISMMLASYLGMNTLKHTDLDYDISPIPFIYEPRTLGITLGIGVHRQSAHKDEALLLVHYLTSERGRQYILDHTLSLPAYRQMSVCPTKPGLNSPSRYAIFREMLFSYRTNRDLNVPTAAFPVLSGLLRMYWSDLIDEQELCDRLVEELSAAALPRAREGLVVE